MLTEEVWLIDFSWVETGESHGGNVMPWEGHRLKGESHCSGLGVKIKFSKCGKAASTGLDPSDVPSPTVLFLRHRYLQDIKPLHSDSHDARWAPGKLPSHYFSVPPKRVQECIQNLISVGNTSKTFYVQGIPAPLAYLMHNCRYLKYFLQWKSSKCCFFMKSAWWLPRRKRPQPELPQQHQARHRISSRSASPWSDQGFRGQAGRKVLIKSEECGSPSTSSSETKWKKGMNTSTSHHPPDLL